MYIYLDESSFIFFKLIIIIVIFYCHSFSFFTNSLTIFSCSDRYFNAYRQPFTLWAFYSANTQTDHRAVSVTPFLTSISREQNCNNAKFLMSDAALYCLYWLHLFIHKKGLCSPQLAQLFHAGYLTCGACLSCH